MCEARLGCPRSGQTLCPGGHRQLLDLELTPFSLRLRFPTCRMGSSSERILGVPEGQPLNRITWLGVGGEDAGSECFCSRPWQLSLADQFHSSARFRSPEVLMEHHHSSEKTERGPGLGAERTGALRNSPGLGSWVPITGRCV